MFSDEEIKESSLTRPDDELISIQEVCLVDKYDKKDFGFNSDPLLFNSDRSNLDVLRFFRDGFLEGLEQQQAKFAWTEEDGNIASLVSSPGFDMGSTFGREFDAALTSEMKEADTSGSGIERSSNELKSPNKLVEPNVVSSTSGSTGTVAEFNERSKSKSACKIDKEDPRSRLHFVKYIKRHGRTIKLWECGICSREFQHQYTLMRHLPTHTDERNYHCDECSKSFRQLSTLSQHRAIHSAERPYSCEVCNKTFNRVSTLISHRKTHSDEKPYRCHICAKGFHQKGNLRNHLFTHTNERPYRCNICQKGFNQQSNLVCHKNKEATLSASNIGFLCLLHLHCTRVKPECVAIINNMTQAHPDNKETISVERVSCPTVRQATSKIKCSKARPPSEHCEVTSSTSPKQQRPRDLADSLWGGVIVDPIKTYHMGVAMATRQTPFALLQSDSGIPVLVKVVDTKLPGGKQMLVPATAEDLRVGGKIVLKEDDSDSQNVDVETIPRESAVQIRVPVVATVVPRVAPGGGLRLTVREPHHAYHSALAADDQNGCIDSNTGICNKNSGCLLTNETIVKEEATAVPGPIISSSYSLLPSAPSPPLDFIPLDLFEPMECMPLGPQITAVNIEQPPSDDSDIFITKFEEAISDSD